MPELTRDETRHYESLIMLCGYLPALAAMDRKRREFVTNAAFFRAVADALDKTVYVDPGSTQVQPQ